MKRARIIASAENKIEQLKELLIKEDLVNSKHNLFYTAAKIERDDDGFELRMVEKIVNILRDMGMQVDKFTAEENKNQRKYLIDKLSEELINHSKLPKTGLLNLAFILSLSISTTVPFV